MSNETQNSTGTLCRLNMFVVPKASREVFRYFMEQTHAVVRQQDGFISDRMFEQETGPSEINFVTTMEFAGPDAIARAVAAVAAMDRENGIDRASVVSKLGVRAEMGIFRTIGLQDLR